MDRDRAPGPGPGVRPGAEQARREAAKAEAAATGRSRYDPDTRKREIEERRGEQIAGRIAAGEEVGFAYAEAFELILMRGEPTAAR